MRKFQVGHKRSHTRFTQVLTRLTAFSGDDRMCGRNVESLSTVIDIHFRFKNHETVAITTVDLSVKGLNDSSPHSTVGRNRNELTKHPSDIA